MKKVVLVDDEASARQLLGEYLSNYSGLVVVGEANNGVDAIKVINKFKPDIVFMDVQMPGMTGFEVLPHLEELPQLIFSTAYDQYALQAFEVHAVDYLLKPYTKSRFEKAIERVRDGGSASQGEQSLAEKVIMEEQTYPARILVQFGKKLITVAVEDIVRIEAAKDYAQLVVKDATYLSNYGISKLEEKLNPELFLRVHRSSIINIQYIDSVEKHPNSFEVIMKNGDIVRVSRGYMPALKKLMF